MEVTPHQAKKIIADKLRELGISGCKLTARTVRFTDLARHNVVYVSVLNWTPSPKWAFLEEVARANGFRVE